VSRGMALRCVCSYNRTVREPRKALHETCTCIPAAPYPGIRTEMGLSPHATDTDLAHPPTRTTRNPLHSLTFLHPPDPFPLLPSSASPSHPHRQASRASSWYPSAPRHPQQPPPTAANAAGPSKRPSSSASRRYTSCKPHGRSSSSVGGALQQEHSLVSTEGSEDQAAGARVTAGDTGRHLGKDTTREEDSHSRRHLSSSSRGQQQQQQRPPSSSSARHGGQVPRSSSSRGPRGQPRSGTAAAAGGGGEEGGYQSVLAGCPSATSVGTAAVGLGEASYATSADGGLSWASQAGGSTR
jgi:hypothetical protein